MNCCAEIEEIKKDIRELRLLLGELADAVKTIAEEMEEDKT